jgi:hypothetical protein
MDYILKEYTINDLVNLIDSESIDLNPDYQRNYIWSPKDQNYLVDTIIKGYPLPSFFLYSDKNGKYEMVDGQQRSKTIYRFIKGNISSSKETGSKFYKDLSSSQILSYRLSFILLENLAPTDNLKDFYVLINKKGIHLNVPEVNKSEHYDKLFMKLANEVLEYQNLIELDLFTEASINRMNDRAYIEELLGYLLLGVKEKKKVVENIYKDDINEEEYQDLKNSFYSIIDKIAVLNKVKPINKTRYKQKNDFYTLFSFINENLDEDIDVLIYQYKILLILDGSDKFGKQFIRPTNENSKALKEYANNCVSQSNSSLARENRLNFFNSMLKNKNFEENEILIDVLNFLSEIYGDDKIDLKEIGGFNIIDVRLLNF